MEKTAHEAEAAAAITIATNIDKDTVQKITIRASAITDLTNKGYILYFNVNINYYHFFIVSVRKYEGCCCFWKG